MTLAPRGWIVRSHIDLRGNEALLIRVWKPLPNIRVFKNLKGKHERESPKKTAFASDGYKWQ